jgi:hypothetical protein
MRDPLLEALVPAAERAKVGATFDGLFDVMTGPTSARFSFTSGPKLGMEYDIVYGLKPGSDGKKVLAMTEELCNAPWLAKLIDTATQGEMKLKLSSKREGDELVTKFLFDTKKLPAAKRAELKGVPFFDGTPLEMRSALAGDRLVLTTGPTAKARMAALRQATGGTPSGELAAAVADTKDADGLYYADLAALFKPMLGLAAQSAQAGGGGGQAAAMMGMAGGLLQNAKLSTWVSYRGGEDVAIAWRIPMSTFESVATMFKQVTGMMGGGGPQ